LGGDLMQKLAALVKHYRELAFMGFVEVLFNLKTILGNIKYAKMILPNSNLMSLFLIDYPGFNMRIAKWARGIPTLLHIAPNMGLEENRITDIKKMIKCMLFYPLKNIL
jgi:lipid-A-disaccharide synthase